MRTKTPRQINAERKKAGLPRLNFNLFRAIIEKLEAAPLAYSQHATARRSDESPCGTVACIGGWADILSAPSARTAKWRALNISLDRGGKALGVTKGEHWASEGEESLVLFNNVGPKEHGAWPKPYARQLNSARSPEKAAMVAINYLTHIIETGKVTE